MRTLKFYKKKPCKVGMPVCKYRKTYKKGGASRDKKRGRSSAAKAEMAPSNNEIRPRVILRRRRAVLAVPAAVPLVPAIPAAIDNDSISSKLTAPSPSPSPSPTPLSNSDSAPAAKKSRTPAKDIALFLSKKARSDAKHDFTTPDFEILNNSLPTFMKYTDTSWDDEHKSFNSSVSGVKFTELMGNLRTNPDVIQTINTVSGITYSVKGGPAIDSDILNKLLVDLTKKQEFTIIYDSSCINFMRLFGTGSKKHNTLLNFVKNLEFQADSATKPIDEILKAMKSKTGFSINVIEEESNEEQYPCFDEDLLEMKNMFFSRFNIILNRRFIKIIDKIDPTKFILESVIDIKYHDLKTGEINSINDAGKYSTINKCKAYIDNAGNLLQKQIGYTSKRGGDWFQGLVTLLKGGGVNRKYRLEFDHEKKTWFIVTHDIILLSYCLYLGVNAIFAKQQDSEGAQLVVVFYNESSNEGYDPVKELAEFWTADKISEMDEIDEKIKIFMKWYEDKFKSYNDNIDTILVDNGKSVRKDLTKLLKDIFYTLQESILLENTFGHLYSMFKKESVKRSHDEKLKYIFYKQISNADFETTLANKIKTFNKIYKYEGVASDSPYSDAVTPSKAEYSISVAAYIQYLRHFDNIDAIRRLKESKWFTDGGIHAEYKKLFTSDFIYRDPDSRGDKFRKQKPKAAAKKPAAGTLKIKRPPKAKKVPSPNPYTKTYKVKATKGGAYKIDTLLDYLEQFKNSGKYNELSIITLDDGNIIDLNTEDLVINLIKKDLPKDGNARTIIRFLKYFNNIFETEDEIRGYSHIIRTLKDVPISKWNSTIKKFTNDEKCVMIVLNKLADLGLKIKINTKPISIHRKSAATRTSPSPSPSPSPLPEVHMLTPEIAANAVPVKIINDRLEETQTLSKD